MSTRKTQIPSEQQIDRVLKLLELDAAQHAQARGHLATIGWSMFSDVAPLQISVPGTRTFHAQGYDPVKIIPYGSSGLTLKVHMIEASNRPRSLELELYALEDFEAVVREAGEEIVSFKVTDTIRSLQGAFSAQEILEMFKSSFERNARAFPLLNALSRSDISAERDVRRRVKRAHWSCSMHDQCR